MSGYAYSFLLSLFFIAVGLYAIKTSYARKKRKKSPNIGSCTDDCSDDEPEDC